MTEKLTYERISEIVYSCRDRQRLCGEGDQMLSRWISEAISTALSAPPVEPQGAQGVEFEQGNQPQTLQRRAFQPETGAEGNQPEIVGWLLTRSTEAGPEVTLSQFPITDGDRTLGWFDEPLVRLSDYQALKAERDELQQTFDFRWEADMRAIKRWREANPGNDLVWPDHVDLILWQEARIATLVQALEQIEQRLSGEGLTGAARDVLAERRRQVEAEGWTPGHDDQHADGALARAAGIYAILAGSNATDYRNAIGGYALNDILRGLLEHYWPWDRTWLKPATRRRDLVKAGALILAELERLDRIVLSSMKEPKNGRNPPELLTTEEKSSLLMEAEDLWAALQANNIGGYSDANRPFYILHIFKLVIEKYGHRDVGINWSKNDLDALKEPKNG
jgi:hypothetical protein